MRIIQHGNGAPGGRGVEHIPLTGFCVVYARNFGKTTYNIGGQELEVYQVPQQVPKCLIFRQSPHGFAKQVRGAGGFLMLSSSPHDTTINKQENAVNSCEFAIVLTTEHP